MHSRLIKLSGTSNVRDLGGYKTDDNKITKFKKFIRSSGIHTLTDADKKILVDYNIKTIIDLRNNSEVDKNPDPKLSTEIKYYNIPIGNVDLSEAKKYGLKIELISTFYLLIAMQSKKYIKEVFDIFLERHTYGGVLFHCTAGKDRTGIVSVLLLSVNNVPESTVLEDYSESYENSLDILNRLKAETPYAEHFNESFFRSDPEFMEVFINYIKNHHGSINGFFEYLGYSSDEIKELSKLLTD